MFKLFLRLWSNFYAVIWSNFLESKGQRIEKSKFSNNYSDILSCI